jgi:hypothetical protein
VGKDQQASKCCSSNSWYRRQILQCYCHCVIEWPDVIDLSKIPEINNLSVEIVYVKIVERAIVWHAAGGKFLQ